MAHDVFISYGSEDKLVADAVCARLEARGVRCWIAPRDAQPGRSYGECIADALRECRVLVLVFSANANLSRHVSNEVERAVHNNLTVIPFRIEDVTPSPALEFFIGSVHWLDALTQPIEEHLDELGDSVQGLLSGQKVQPQRRQKRSGLTPQLRNMLVGGVILVLLAVIAYLLMNRDGGGQQIAGTTGPGLNPAQPGVSNPPQAAPTFAGCWIYNTVRMTMAPDGRIIGPLDARWAHQGGNQYRITWPATADTVTLSADGRTATGSNNFTGPGITIRRLAGRRDQFEGSWQWYNTPLVSIRRGGQASAGGVTGTWTEVSPATYRVDWNFVPIDQLVLSADGNSVTGQNNLAQPVGGTRVACN